MPYEEGQPTLMGCLGWIPMKHIVKTPVFGGRYVRLYNYIESLPFQYESGAILGCARRNSLSVLERMLVIPSATEGQLMTILQDEAKERLEEFRNQTSKEPDTFGELIFERELEKVTGLSLIDCFKAYASGNKKIIKGFDDKFPLAQAEPYIKMFGMEGIGFGVSFPELTEKMYRNAFENIDMDIWAEARAHGLAISEKPTMLNFEEQDELVLQMVAGYASEYYPELLDPLDLRRYLNVTQTEMG